MLKTDRPCVKCKARDRCPSGRCRPCEREYRRKRLDNPIEWEIAMEMRRAWAKANPERTRASNRAWEKANPEKKRASESRWRKANPEKRSAHNRTYYLANCEKILAKQRAKRLAKKQQRTEQKANEIPSSM